MDKMRDLKHQMPEIQKQLGIQFKNPETLLTAFIHPSYLNENLTPLQSNQRLEFIGDAALDLIVAAWLYRRFPNDAEGMLSIKRAHLVDAKACSGYVKLFYIDRYLLVSNGQDVTDAVLADFFESLIGAIYIDSGMEAAQRFLHLQCEESMEAILGDPPRNWKAELQDLAQKSYGLVPTYQVIQEKGPDHAKIFCVRVQVKELSAIGSGPSKKLAQQEAAKSAMEQMHGKK